MSSKFSDISTYFNRNIHIQSVHNLHLGTSSNNIAYGRPSRGSRENLFRIYGTENNAQIKAVYGSTGWVSSNTAGEVYISHNGSVKQSRWEIIKVGPHIRFKSKYNGRYLKIGGQLGVELYQHYYKQGWKKTLPPGKHSVGDAKTFPDNQVSSINIPPFTEVTLYEHPHFRGKSKRFVGPQYINNLGQHRMRSKGPYWFLSRGSSTWNDTLSSIAITSGNNITGLTTTSKSDTSKTLFSVNESHETSLLWSSAGDVAGHTAKINMNVAAKPSGATWRDNYLCIGGTHLPAIWVDTAEKLANYKNMKFVRFQNSADPIFVKNKIGFCYPKSAPFELKFTPGVDGWKSLVSEGFRVLEIRESADSKAWASCWLGMKYIKPQFSETPTDFKLHAISGGWTNFNCKNRRRLAYGRVEVNGNNIAELRSIAYRGLTIVKLGPFGKLIYRRSFDTHGTVASVAANAFVREFKKQVSNVNDDSVVVVLTYADASKKLTGRHGDNARLAMMESGAGQFGFLGFRGSYIFVVKPRTNEVLFEQVNNCGDVKVTLDCGVKCSNIFDLDYYKQQNKDVNDNALSHWTKIGIKEGRQGHPKFDPKAYYDLYEDLQRAYGKDYSKLARHYVTYGQREGRIATFFKPERKFGGLLTNYLVSYVDSGDSKSYSGGRDWKDLSGNGNNWKWDKKPNFDGLTIRDTQIAGACKGPAGKQLKIGKDQNRGSYTIVMVSRTKSIIDSSLLEIKSNAGQSGLAVKVGSKAQDSLTVYGGYEYRTLDGTSAYSTKIRCQNGAIRLPSGWEIAPYSSAVVKNIVARSPWGTSNLIFSNGAAYGTSKGRYYRWPGGDWLHKRGNRYSVRLCHARILIRRRVGGFSGDGKTAVISNMNDGTYAYIPNDWDKEHMYTFVRTVSGKLCVYMDGKRLTKTSKVSSMPNLNSNGQIMINSNGKLCADVKICMIYNYGMPKAYVKDIYDWYAKTNSNRIIEQQSRLDKLCHKLNPSLPVYKGICLFASSNGYKKGSTSFKDRSGHQHTLKFNKAPRVSDGMWKSNGDVILTGPASSSIGLEPDSDFTFVIRAKTNTVNTSRFFVMNGFDPQGLSTSLGPGLGGTPRLTMRQGGNVQLSYNIPNDWNANTTYVVTGKGKLRKLYINGILKQIVKDKRTMHFNHNVIEMMTSKKLNNWEGRMSDVLIYNRAITEEQIKKLSRYLNRIYVVKDSDWNGAVAVCAAKGKQICTQDELIFNGKVVDPVSRKNALAPIGDKPGKWINLTTGKVQNASGLVKNAHIKCCPLPKRKPFFETMTMVDKDVAYIFKDKLVLKYNMSDPELTTGPHNLNSVLPHLPPPMNTGNFNASYVQINENKLYLVKDRVALVYDLKNKKVLQGPTDVRQIFTGLRGTFKKGYFDAILSHQSYPGACYIFKGDQLCYYDLTNNKTGESKSIKDWQWSIPSGFFSGRFTAVLRHGQKVYYIREEKYSNGQSVRNIIPDWTGLLRPFISENLRCVILNKLVAKNRSLTTKYINSNPGLYKKYNNRLNKQIREQSKLCKFVSVQSFYDRLVKEKRRLKKLLKNIKGNRLLQAKTKEEIKIIKQQINKLVGQIADLDMKIGIEKAKKCPVNAKCTKPSMQYTKMGSQVSNVSKCDSYMITRMLKSKGYRMDKIKQLSSAINYVPSINDYDIRTHPDYFKYVGKNELKGCPKGLSSKDAHEKAMSAGQDMEHEQGSKAHLFSNYAGDLKDLLKSSSKYKKAMFEAAEREKFNKLVAKNEKKALDIVQQALLQYQSEFVAKKMAESAAKNKFLNAKSIDELQRATGELADGMKLGEGISMHLSLLKEIQQILNKTKSHPKYLKLKTDMDQLIKQLAHDKIMLQKTTIPEHVSRLENKVKLTNEAIKKKRQSLEKFAAKMAR